MRNNAAWFSLFVRKDMTWVGSQMTGENNVSLPHFWLFHLQLILDPLITVNFFDYSQFPCICLIGRSPSCPSGASLRGSFQRPVPHHTHAKGNTGCASGLRHKNYTPFCRSYEATGKGVGFRARRSWFRHNSGCEHLIQSPLWKGES